VLRFGNQRAPRPRPVFSSQARGVWMLLLMLGAVILLMRQVKQPATVEFLGQVFNSSATEADSKKSLQPGDNRASPNKAEMQDASTARNPASDGAWDAVKDNATFVPAEQEAWFLLWDEVARTPAKELERQAVGPVTYAQLVNQPKVYRGLPVRVRGRVLRESVKQAPENSLGLGEYHQLVLATIGGGDWPMMVYVRELPEGFPRGDELKVDLSAVGLFFKNWSYPYDGGMGLAPVIVADTIDWRPATAPVAPAASPLSTKGIWVGGAAALMAAIGFTSFVMRRTRRPAVGSAETPDFERLETES
jgi:hypothetical protein